MDQGLDLCALGFRERARIRIACEKGRGDAVDAGIRRLRRQDGGHQELKGVREIQLRVCVRVLRLELAQNLAGFSGGFHVGVLSVGRDFSRAL